MKATNFAALYFGKLPNFSDFIRHNASGAEVRAFDHWIQEGLHRTSKHFDQNWNTIYNNAPAYHFLFCPDDTDKFLVGIIHLSHDKSERKYPFVVSTQIEKITFEINYVPLIPLIFSPFFNRSKQLIIDGLQGLPQLEIKARVDELCDTFQDNLISGLKFFENYLTKTTQERFWSCLFGSFDDRRKFLIFKNLIDIFSPFHTQELSSLGLGMRFPLSRNADSTENEVCFWMQVCMHLLRKAWIIPNVFWKISEKDEQNYFFLFFREPSSKTFTQLLQPELENDTICKVEEDGFEKIFEAAQNIPLKFLSALENDELTLNTFLERLEVFGTP